jgi:hypothetical protein
VQAAGVKRSGIWTLFAFLPAAWGCHASVNAEAKAEKDVAEYDKPLETTAPSDDGLGSPGAGPFQEDAMIGARHDLQLAADAPQPTCNCLAVAVGQATDPRFFWEAGAPNTTDTQLVFAMTSEGLACPDASEDSLGASYWGYKKEGDNIVVVVEEARFGRPITSGAIIPRPGPAGQVLVQPLDSRVPFGRPLSQGDRYCQVSSPAPQ